jgi:hypothetical protein
MVAETIPEEERWLMDNIESVFLLLTYHHKENASPFQNKNRLNILLHKVN